MTPARGHKRYLKNLVLDRNYQLAFTAVLVVGCAILMAGLGWLVLRKADGATQIAIQNVQTSTLDAGAARETIADILRRRELLTWIMIGVGAAITLGLAAYGIKMTHQVAGPLYKIAYHCDRVIDGTFTELTALRRHDQLVDLHAHFRQAYNTLRERQHRDAAALRAVIDAADKAGFAARSPEIAALLEDLRVRLRAKEVTLG